MARPSLHYQPRSPAQRVLYQIVRDHYETFRAQAASMRDGEGLPRFIDEEFRGFVKCGFLAGGFARFQCERCRHEHLVPFSCKSRAICPSCGGRRMAERAAHLVDHVFPVVPVRQWVLTLPHRVRYLLAWDHALCRAVMRLFMRAVLGYLRRRARQTQGVAGGRSGAVVIVQRFGAALNTNVHGHALVLDGVFAEDDAGALRFHPAPPPTDEAMDAVVATIARRVGRLLARRGVVEEGEAAGADPCHAHREGFDLHAGLVVPARDRARLERTCRYALRPPVADDRIRLTETGQVRLELRHRWRDGTTHLLFDPLELLERVAALTPRPRINLVLYYGVLAAHAGWRSRLGTEAADSGRAAPLAPSAMGGATGPPTVPADTPARAVRHRSNLLWAQLMQRSFGYDVLACARCGGRLRLLALIEQASVIERILAHLGLPTAVPAPRPARAPPMPRDTLSRWADDDLPAA